ncbi:DUF1778 domain-containing protein [Dyadobacter sp. CY323]|uniref:DUF1778 domain-containing protein n=1 Tax=Dyadobacter sp. CY323 TaxID=2907302 RepID=UPI001F41DC70|nr:DUF1778 domain-containing protein [Dyadobacter sp. CY323]MCE6991299.1 DUF1778 domain-containing protein [Dyadobacter sp. CY323]
MKHVNPRNNKMDSDLILKTIEDKELFIETILNPPEPNEKLKRAFMRYGEKIQNNNL